MNCVEKKLLHLFQTLFYIYMEGSIPRQSMGFAFLLLVILVYLFLYLWGFFWICGFYWGVLACLNSSLYCKR